MITFDIMLVTSLGCPLHEHSGLKNARIRTWAYAINTKRLPDTRCKKTETRNGEIVYSKAGTRPISEE